MCENLNIQNNPLYTRCLFKQATHLIDSNYAERDIDFFFMHHEILEYTKKITLIFSTI